MNFNVQHKRSIKWWSNKIPNHHHYYHIIVLSNVFVTIIEYNESEAGNNC